MPQAEPSVLDALMEAAQDAVSYEAIAVVLTTADLDTNETAAQQRDALLCGAATSAFRDRQGSGLRCAAPRPSAQGVAGESVGGHRRPVGDLERPVLQP